MEQTVDIFIVGGGINGCGAAADAAERGLSVMLCDKGDIASQTSSKSTKLIHGGLRYLEQYHFSLVRKALIERQKLIDLAPHLVRPLPMVMPYHPSMRPAWLIRTGLFIYDHLSTKNSLPKSRILLANREPSYFSPLKSQYTKAFLFYDGSTNDCRLTVENALQAKKYGARIHNYTALIKAEASDGLWHLTLQNTKDLSISEIKARCLINAAGPWVNHIHALMQVPANKKIKLVKGSHIVVPKCYEGKQAYFMQSADKRVIFAIPYYGMTMIGTTDENYQGDMDNPIISDEEIHYLTDITNQYFKKNISKNDIITSWSGLRPLINEDNASLQEMSRDYHIAFCKQPAAYISIYGGKITTYRKLAEEVIDHTRDIFPALRASQSDKTLLPGAAYQDKDYDAYKSYAHQQYAFLESEHLNYYLDNYGCLTEKLLSGCRKIADLGQHFACHLFAKEVDYLIQHEWAKSAEDVLWRRSRQGLGFPEASLAALEAYIRKQSDVL